MANLTYNQVVSYLCKRYELPASDARQTINVLDIYDKYYKEFRHPDEKRIQFTTLHHIADYLDSLENYDQDFKDVYVDQDLENNVSNNNIGVNETEVKEVKPSKSINPKTGESEMTNKEILQSILSNQESINKRLDNLENNKTETPVKGEKSKQKKTNKVKSFGIVSDDFYTAKVTPTLNRDTNEVTNYKIVFESNKSRREWDRILKASHVEFILAHAEEMKVLAEQAEDATEALQS